MLRGLDEARAEDPLDGSLECCLLQTALARRLAAFRSQFFDIKEAQIHGLLDVDRLRVVLGVGASHRKRSQRFHVLDEKRRLDVIVVADPARACIGRMHVNALGHARCVEHPSIAIACLRERLALCVSHTATRHIVSHTVLH